MNKQRPQCGIYVDGVYIRVYRGLAVHGEAYPVESCPTFAGVLNMMDAMSVGHLRKYKLDTDVVQSLLQQDNAIAEPWEI